MATRNRKECVVQNVHHTRNFIYNEKYLQMPASQSQNNIATKTPVLNGNASGLLSNVEDLEFSDIQCSNIKPSALVEEGDITGQQLFGFQTPKRRNALAQKTAESFTSSPAEPKTPVQHSIFGKTAEATPQKVVNGNTPKVGTISASVVSGKTPYNLRKRLKRKIAAVLKEDSENSSDIDVYDISASESEWEGDDDDDDSENENKVPTKTVCILQHHCIGPSLQKASRLNYVPMPDEYFIAHASSKLRTSNHTLNHLQTPRLFQEQLKDLLSQITPSHQKALQMLDNQSQKLFAKWTFTLKEGFNILLYGIGSKRDLMNAYQGTLTDRCVVVNGFFPSLTIQEVVNSILHGILGLKNQHIELFEAVDLIKTSFSDEFSDSLFLFVHNIDGPMLRNVKSQEVLATLGSAPGVHLVASVDHINAPLMWDQSMLSLFGFLWWDVTTFLPYSNETAYESSLLVQQSGNLALSSLQNVFCSLTSNAKGIFLLMAQYQISRKEKHNMVGMPFKELYSSCREALLVSSDLALRSQLTEFLDHRLVRSRRGADGSELLTIPIKCELLSQFVKDQEASM